MTPRAKTRLKIWLVLLGVFALGAVTGVSLDSVYRMRASGVERGGRGDKAKFETMKRDLGLSDSQAEQVRVVLDETRNQFKVLREECRPKFDVVRQGARARIRALLNPEQQKRFDEKTAERDARHKREEDRRDAP